MDRPGRLPVRSSAMAPSVDPKTSMIRTPKRVAVSSTTWGDPSLPKADPQGVVGVVGASRRRQQVGQDLAGVVEPGDAVAAHVGQEPRRAEPTRQRERRAGDQGRSQPGHQRVRVKQRHGRVARRRPGVELEHHRHAVAGGEQPPLGAADGLRGGGGARREQQDPQAVDVGFCVLARRPQTLPTPSRSASSSEDAAASADRHRRRTGRRRARPRAGRRRRAPRRVGPRGVAR